jgi:hypothetical protein
LPHGHQMAQSFFTLAPFFVTLSSQLAYDQFVPGSSYNRSAKSNSRQEQRFILAGRHDDYIESKLAGSWNSFALMPVFCQES